MKNLNLSKWPVQNGEALSQKQVEGDFFSNSSHECEQLLLMDK